MPAPLSSGGLNFERPAMTPKDLWIILAVVWLVIAMCGAFFVLAVLI